MKFNNSTFRNLAQATLGVLLCGALGSMPLAAQDSANSFREATLIAERMLAEQEAPITEALRRVEAHRATVSAQSSSQELGAEASDAVLRYAESVGDLRAFPVPETLPELSIALLSEEAEVRLSGLVALRQGASSRSPRSPALMAARALISSDDVPANRRQAFEAYCRWGDQEDVLALSKALGREPGPVRDLAVREWLRIERERQ